MRLPLKIRETAAEARRTARRLDEAIRRLGSQNDATEGVAKLQSVRARPVTAPGPSPQPMLIVQLNSLSQTAGAADRRAGRSALECSQVMKDELAAIKADVSRLLAE